MAGTGRGCTQTRYSLHFLLYLRLRLLPNAHREERGVRPWGPGGGWVLRKASGSMHHGPVPRGPGGEASAPQGWGTGGQTSRRPGASVSNLGLLPAPLTCPSAQHPPSYVWKDPPGFPKDAHSREAGSVGELSPPSVGPSAPVPHAHLMPFTVHCPSPSLHFPLYQTGACSLPMGLRSTEPWWVPLGTYNPVGTLCSGTCRPRAPVIMSHRSRLFPEGL